MVVVRCEEDNKDGKDSKTGEEDYTWPCDDADYRCVFSPFISAIHCPMVVIF